MKFEIELDEAQVQALCVYGDQCGLTAHEMVQFAVLTEVEAAIALSTNPEVTHEEWIAIGDTVEARLVERIKAQRA